jgi:hypothetical protein
MEEGDVIIASNRRLPQPKATAPISSASAGTEYNDVQKRFRKRAGVEKLQPD